MKIAIHQPHYWPWIPYIAKVIKSDIFVFLDHVKFTKNGFQNRNLLKSSNGEFWLTLPVSFNNQTKLNDVRISCNRFKKKHLKTIKQFYGTTAGYALWEDEIEKFYSQDYEHLNDISISSIEFLLNKVGFSGEIVKSSDLHVENFKGSELILEICKKLGGSTYYSGSFGSGYLDVKSFADKGVEIYFQEINIVQYEQQFHKNGFISNLSALDLILNCPESSFEVFNNSSNWRSVHESI